MSVTAPVALPAAIPAGALATVRGDAAALFALLTGSRLNALLVCVPLGCLSQVLGWSPLLRFALVRAFTPGQRGHRTGSGYGSRGGSKISHTSVRVSKVGFSEPPEALRCCSYGLRMVFVRHVWFRV